MRALLRLALPVGVYLAALGYERWQERERVREYRARLHVQSASPMTVQKWRNRVRAEHNV
jgi:hypothetical protein